MNFINLDVPLYGIANCAFDHLKNIKLDCTKEVDANYETHYVAQIVICCQHIVQCYQYNEKLSAFSKSPLS